MTRRSSKLGKDIHKAAAVAPIRDAIIAESSRLPIWQWDGGLALYYLLTALEYEIQEQFLELRRHGRSEVPSNIGGIAAGLGIGLNTAVYEVYRRHPGLSLTQFPEPFDSAALTEASRVVRYGFGVACAVAALDDTCYGTRDLHVTRSDIQLPFADEGTIEHEAWKTAHGGLIDPGRPPDYALLQLEMSPEGARLWEIIDRTTQYIGGTRILYRPHPAVKTFFAGSAERSLATVDLPVDIRIGGYSLEEFRTFYRYLYERAAIHQAYCHRAALRRPGRQSVGSLVLPVTRRELYADLVESAKLRAAAFDHIVTDLTYSASEQWTGIHYQPLFPVAEDTLLLAPTLITTGIWENNMVNMWARKHPDEYSRAVSEVKKRGAAAIAQAFGGHGFIVAANRKYYLGKRQELGDVDVAVFDPSTRMLVLAEMKWLIPPADAHEARSRDLELSRGARQVRDASDFVTSHLTEAAEQLFGSHRAPFSPAIDVRMFLIARGHLGSFGMAKHGITVLDYHRVLDYLRDLPAETSLVTVVADLQDLMNRWSAPVGRDIVELRLQLAGYNIRMPAFRWSAQPP